MRPYLVVSFDHQYLQENPRQLQNLAKFYCFIWETDENFGEYRQCPNCHRYYNYQEVEVLGIRSCVDCHIPLVLAWEPEKVAQTILEESSNPEFCGFLAFNLSGDIVGFAWANVLNFSDITNNWGEEISTQLQTQTSNNHQVAYFNELAVHPSMRGLGIGKELVRQISIWMRKQHPEKMALLRTHENSKARGIYEKIGYRVFATDTMYGYGRIMMVANSCANLVISNLN